jgi:hypothetical protein
MANVERKQESTPSLSPADLQQVIDNLLAARQRSLVGRQLGDILSSIDYVITHLLDPTAEERREAEAQLPAETGLSPAMIRHTLPLIFRNYHGGLLEEFLDDELGSASRLDRFAELLSGNYKVYGLPLIVHSLAGN